MVKAIKDRFDLPSVLAIKKLYRAPNIGHQTNNTENKYA